MKKLIFTALLMFTFCVISSAQSVPMVGSGDSVTNTETKYCTYRVNANPTAVSVQVVLTKASGTVAGKTYLEGSIDGVNYYKIDSFTATNQTTNANIFVVTNYRNYTHYRTTTTGSGTMKVYLNTKILIRKD